MIMNQLRIGGFLAITKGAHLLVRVEHGLETLLRRVIMHVIDPVHAARRNRSHAFGG
jgi:uncharacterized membrane protein